MERRTLSHTCAGDFVTIKEMAALGSMRRRLQDIGFIEGTAIEVLYKSPAGDPVAYLVRGAVIALRNEDSANIFIE